MRIVQTFFNACHAGRSGGAERWTAGKNPLEERFFNTCYAGRSGRAERGWAHADYSLMSWSLSCHSLRKNYGEVALCTDTAWRDLGKT